MGMSPNRFLKNLKNLKRTASYHDKSLRQKADWVHWNNRRNVDHLMDNTDDNAYHVDRKYINEVYNSQKDQK
jgi:hypothetical protein